jgi:hypothetical protein
MATVATFAAGFFTTSFRAPILQAQLPDSDEQITHLLDLIREPLDRPA